MPHQRTDRRRSRRSTASRSGRPLGSPRSFWAAQRQSSAAGESRSTRVLEDAPRAAEGRSAGGSRDLPAFAREWETTTRAAPRCSSGSPTRRSSTARCGGAAAAGDAPMRAMPPMEHSKPIVLRPRLPGRPEHCGQFEINWNLRASYTQDLLHQKLKRLRRTAKGRQGGARAGLPPRRALTDVKRTSPGEDRPAAPSWRRSPTASRRRTARRNSPPTARRSPQEDRGRLRAGHLRFTQLDETVVRLASVFGEKQAQEIEGSRQVRKWRSSGAVEQAVAVFAAEIDDAKKQGRRFSRREEGVGDGSVASRRDPGAADRQRAFAASSRARRRKSIAPRRSARPPGAGSATASAELHRERRARGRGRQGGRGRAARRRSGSRSPRCPPRGRASPRDRRRPRRSGSSRRRSRRSTTARRTASSRTSERKEKEFEHERQELGEGEGARVAGA